MANNPADQNNALLSTPVATIAVDLFLDRLKRPIDPPKHVSDLAEQSVDRAEHLVSLLYERGHLPRQMPAEEPPPVDDAVLLAQGFFLGLLRWEPFSPGDPRGSLYITAPESPTFGYQRVGKLKSGVMPLDDAGRQHLENLISERRRGL